MHPLLLTTVLAIAVAQQSQDPIKNFCRRHQHQTCIIDSKLYIDGGKVHYGGSVENGSVAEQNSFLLWEDTRDTQNDYMFPPQYDNLTKDINVPSTSGGVLWPDSVNKLFYLFGGVYNNITDVHDFNSLWFFDVIYNTWNESIASDGSQADIAWPAFGAGVVSHAGIAYYYGGYLSNKTVPGWGGEPLMLNSLVSYDMNSRTWFNRTYDRTPRAEGMLHYLPASTSGMLVYLGGVEMNSSGAMSFADMSQIHLHDINDNKWYTEKASGDVPYPRRGSCGGVVWAADRTSYNIYVVGGIAENGRALDDAYILTLPTFQWIRILPKPPATVPNYGNKGGWSSCNVIRDSQMIIIGGSVTNSSMAECDVPDVGGQHNILLGQENVELGHWWHAISENTTGYRVPDQIVSVIGGDTNGHATKTTPPQGWTVPSFSGYWSGTNIPKIPTATRFVPGAATATSSAPQPTSQSPNDTNVGAIAGGTVGGVVALLGICALVFLCLRRRRKQTAHGPAEPTAPNPHQEEVHKHVAYDHTALSPGYSSPASSPPQGWQGEQGYYHVSPQSHYQSGEWAQYADYPHQQAYHPSPPDPSQSPMYGGRAELSEANSRPAELREVRSSVSSERPDMQEVPGRELR